MSSKDSTGHKTCSKCGALKATDDFYESPGMRDGRRNECKKCTRIARQLHYQANRDTYIRRSQEWKRRNPEKYRELERRRRAARGPEERRRDRDQHLSRQYGLTLADFEFLVITQAGLCAICGKPDGHDLHVDHDHSNGRVRGLLCGSCNRAMGLFHEDAARFEAAGRYLRTPQLPLAAGDRDKRTTRSVRHSPEAPT